MDQRVRIMQPDKAKTVEEIEMKLTQWKSDIRILRESRQRQDLEMLKNDDQMITILIGMLPDAVADHLVSKYSPGSTTLEELSKVLQDHLMKLNQKKTAKKVIKQVVRKEEDDDDDDKGSQEEGGEQHEWKWSDTYGHYLCITVPAAKRPRTEDDSSQAGQKGKGGKTGKGKGISMEIDGKGQKGKATGKGGPKGGCHECGGDHYARECPIRTKRLA